MIRWALYVAERGPARTAGLSQTLAELSAQGLRAAGFMQRSLRDEAGGAGSELLRLGGDERLTLARAASVPRGPHEEAFCSMVFDSQVFARARAWLAEDAPGADLLVLDEIGKLEVAGRGHHDAVLDALKGPAPVLLSVRGDQLFAALERLGLPEPRVSCEPGGSIEAFAGALASLVREGS